MASVPARPARTPRRRPQRSTDTLVKLLGLLALAGACGETSVSFELDPPAAGDPARGRVAQVLVRNFDLEIWVGVDDSVAADDARLIESSGDSQWVIGEVVPDAGHHLGFYFDPATVHFAEITAEGIQTTLDMIRDDPKHFEPGGPGGFDLWAVMVDDVLGLL